MKGIRLLHENGLFSPSGIDSGSKKNWNRKQSMKVHVVIALSHTKAFQHRLNLATASGGVVRSHQKSVYDVRYSPSR